ncbi:MAG TPA: Smr/MutS family protein [Treponemataceae bacterium]|nr:Smr/MutS family protein [Treponemataceae bacterium]
MADFGDILQNWERQKKSEKPDNKKSSLPQDGQAWRYKKTAPGKKQDIPANSERSEDASPLKRNPLNERSEDASPLKRNPLNERSEDASPLKRNPLNERSEDASPLKRNPLNVWLQRYGVVDKDKQLEDKLQQEIISNSDAVKQMICEASIDLHGLTREEADIRLNAFITECVRRGLKKVLIIHGKGNHSNEGPVLSHAVRSFIESDKRLGRFGFADKTLGGKGATWVLIR